MSAGGELPDVVMENIPGTFYIGTFTGPWHQVVHKDAPRYEYLQAAAGDLSVTCMMRTSLFPGSWSRLKNTTPSPIPMFEALAAAFTRYLQTEELHLPSMGDCLAEP